MEFSADDRSARGTPAVSRSALRIGIRKAVGRHLDLTRYRVFLFGSEASGTAVPGSDVDVGIWGPQPVTGAILARILEELESLRMLRLFDVVDFARADETFRAVALRESEPLNDA
jgi:predicted nucleotidyltransferase